jgi:hypothetical protein
MRELPGRGARQSHPAAGRWRRHGGRRRRQHRGAAPVRGARERDPRWRDDVSRDGESIEFREHAAIQAKGKEQPVAVWEVAIRTCSWPSSNPMTVGQPCGAGRAPDGCRRPYVEAQPIAAIAVLPRSAISSSERSSTCVASSHSCLGSRAERTPLGGTGAIRGPAACVKRVDVAYSLDYAPSSRTSPSWRAASGCSATKRRLSASLSSRVIFDTSSGSSNVLTFSTVSFGRPWTRRSKRRRPGTRGWGHPTGSRPGRPQRPRRRVPRACGPACRGASRGEPPPLLAGPPRFAARLWPNQAVSGQSELSKAQLLSAPGRHRGRLSYSARRSGLSARCL